jgi:hypothetical protein
MICPPARPPARPHLPTHISTVIYAHMSALRRSSAIIRRRSHIVSSAWSMISPRIDSDETLCGWQPQIDSVSSLGRTDATVAHRRTRPTSPGPHTHALVPQWHGTARHGVERCGVLTLRAWSPSSCAQGNRTTCSGTRESRASVRRHRRQCANRARRRRDRHRHPHPSPARAAPKARQRPPARSLGGPTPLGIATKRIT